MGVQWVVFVRGSEWYCLSTQRGFEQSHVELYSCIRFRLTLPLNSFLVLDFLKSGLSSFQYRDALEGKKHLFWLSSLRFSGCVETDLSLYLTLFSFRDFRNSKISGQNPLIILKVRLRHWSLYWSGILKRLRFFIRGSVWAKKWDLVIARIDFFCMPLIRLRLFDVEAPHISKP